MYKRQVYRGRLRETDRKIQEIIGLDREQFTQIMMIAQGEFLKLLLASSDERKKIFSGIFHTYGCRAVEEELGRRYSSLKEELGASRQRSSVLMKTLCTGAVSYTHLDVYKRQGHEGTELQRPVTESLQTVALFQKKESQEAV